MEWKKASAETVETFGRIVPDAPGVEKRKMFGYPCSFLNGNMFLGVHGDNIIIRLSAADAAEFRETPGAHTFEPAPGRAMKEYSVVPPALLASASELEAWIQRSLDYVGALPPKEKKAGKRS